LNSTVRTAFLAAATEAETLIGRKEVGERWEEASTLEGMTIGALAAHLGRGVLTAHWYLDMPEPDPPLTTASEYFAAFAESRSDPSTDAGVAARAEEMASAGWARLYLDVGRALDHLTSRLPTEPADHRVPAMGRALIVDEYLRTRIVELVVHLGDLSRSLGLQPPVLADATAIAIGVLLGAARVRHGDQAILNALARRELDTDQALRVL
jgi:hypothetical protein